MPDEPKYAYTLAYYQLESNQKAMASKTLKKLIEDHPEFLNAVSLLADIYMQDGDKQKAVGLYKNTLKTDGISMQDKEAIQQAINSIQENL